MARSLAALCETTRSGPRSGSKLRCWTRSSIASARARWPSRRPGQRRRARRGGHLVALRRAASRVARPARGWEWGGRPGRRGRRLLAGGVRPAWRSPDRRRARRCGFVRARRVSPAGSTLSRGMNPRAARSPPAHPATMSPGSRARPCAPDGWRRPDPGWGRRIPPRSPEAGASPSPACPRRLPAVAPRSHTRAGPQPREAASPARGDASAPVRSPGDFVELVEGLVGPLLHRPADRLG